MPRRLLSAGLRRLRSGYGRFAQATFGTGRPLIELSVNENPTFFGYYDKTPFGRDNRLVLGMTLQTESSQSAAVGYFDTADGNQFKPFGETTTWSWQLGARLQWMPGTDEDIAGYNRVVEGQHGFVVQNVQTGKVLAEYPVPVFDISPDGRYGLSLNFSRLRRMRAGYGYGGVDDATLGRLAPDDDGVVLLDFENGDSRLLISLSSLMEICPTDSIAGAEHYVNHLSFSPSGKRFLFLHLWKRGSERFSRPITADIDGENLFVLEHQVSMSHYAWRNSDELLIHTSRRPHGTRFIMFRDQSEHKRIIGGDILTEAGHPSFSPDGRRLVVDTYPDNTRRQSLYLCTGEGALIERVGRFYSPPVFSGANKCDLHPRWDRSGSRICIDSAHSGRRAMYIIDLDATVPGSAAGSAHC